MSIFSKEAIICFESVSVAIMAEQALIEAKFYVRVMPTPSSIRGGCGFCLRFLPEDLQRAAAFLSERGFAVTEAYLTEAYLREEKEGNGTYKKISLESGEKNVER